MGFFKVVKKGITAGWKVSSWVGTDQIKGNVGAIKDLASAAFIANQKNAKAPKKETFEQCLRRLGISEAALQKRIKNSGQIILMCSLLSIPMALYTLYMFYSGYYLSGFVCLMLTAVLLAYSFREHFNRFQMQQRRLGCTFQEWSQSFSKGKK